KQMELGVIAPTAFAPYIRARFEASGKTVEDSVVEAVLVVTHGHPYGTQELCYTLWEETPDGETATDASFDAALEQVLRSENAHFTRIWDDLPKAQKVVLQALAKEPLQKLTSSEFRRRHGLPTSSSIQRAVDTLVRDELVAKEATGAYRIAEPFLAEWVLHFGS